MSDHQLSRLALSDIRGRATNPKAHDLAEIRASIRRFGFVAPLLMDEGAQELAAGHGRLEVLQSMKAEGEDAPRGIVVRDDSEWMVPVVTGITFDSEQEAEAYLVADNRLVELGGWADPDLHEVLVRQQNLEGIGFDQQDLSDLVARLRARDRPQRDPDDAPDPPAEPVTQPGDLWLLGDHRVLCGDGRDPDALETLMGGGQG